MSYHGVGIEVCPVSGEPVKKPRFFWTDRDRPGPYPNACAMCSDRYPATVEGINAEHREAHQAKVAAAVGRAAKRRAGADVWRTNMVVGRGQRIGSK